MRATKEFHFVDYASRNLPGFRNNVVRVGEVPALMKYHRHTDCYATCFLFDHQLMEYVNQNGGSVSGYQGVCYAHFLPFDIDSQDLAKAQRTAQDLSRLVLDSWGVPEQSLAVFFSGNKGYHLTVATRLFGQVEPGPDISDVFQEVRGALVEEARVRYPDTVDFSIGDRLRLLKLPNTRHSGSGLYKVPLTLHELFTFEPEQIKELARKPRRGYTTDQTGLLPRESARPIPAAVEVYSRSSELVENGAGEDLPAPESFLTRGAMESFLCEAEQKLYEDGVPKGSRSRMVLRELGWIVEAIDLQKSYCAGKRLVPALRGIDLVLTAGECVVLLGPSDAGKTTTLNLVGCLDRPAGGRLTLAGNQIYGDGAYLSEGQLDALRREHVGFVFADFYLLPTLTAVENVQLPLLWGDQHDPQLAHELLNTEIFDTLLEVQVLMERWRREYNTVRPHSALNYRPPAPEAVPPWD